MHSSIAQSEFSGGETLTFYELADEITFGTKAAIKGYLLDSIILFDKAID